MVHQGLGRWCLSQGRVWRMASLPFRPSAGTCRDAALWGEWLLAACHGTRSAAHPAACTSRAAQRAQHAPDYRPSVHALTLASAWLVGPLWEQGLQSQRKIWGTRLCLEVKAEGSTGNEAQEDPGHSWHREMSCKICVRIQTTRVSQGPGPRSCPVPYFTFP